MQTTNFCGSMLVSGVYLNLIFSTNLLFQHCNVAISNLIPWCGNDDLQDISRLCGDRIWYQHEFGTSGRHGDVTLVLKCSDIFVSEFAIDFFVELY